MIMNEDSDNMEVQEDDLPSRVQALYDAIGVTPEYSLEEQKVNGN